MATVIGPTPPGTGVMKPAFSFTPETSQTVDMKTHKGFLSRWIICFLEPLSPYCDNKCATCESHMQQQTRVMMKQGKRRLCSRAKAGIPGRQVTFPVEIFPRVIIYLQSPHHQRAAVCLYLGRGRGLCPRR